MVITLITLRRIRPEVGNYELSFSQISDVLEKGGFSNRNIPVT